MMQPSRFSSPTLTQAKQGSSLALTLTLHSLRRRDKLSRTLMLLIMTLLCFSLISGLPVAGSSRCNPWPGT